VRGPNGDVGQAWLGRWFEDLEVGAIYRHEGSKTITSAENRSFTHETLNTNPIHFDESYAAATPFGRPLVNSCYTLSLVTGISVSDVSQNAFANLGWDEVRLPAPVFEGDTISAETEVLELRPSRSRPSVGVVRVRTRGFNHDSVVVIDFLRSILIYRRGFGPRSSAG
jgi:itaconyl-CoA hydratase